MNVNQNGISRRRTSSIRDSEKAKASQHRVEITSGDQACRDRKDQHARRALASSPAALRAMAKDQPHHHGATDIDEDVIIDEDVSEPEPCQYGRGAMVHRRIMQRHIDVGGYECDRVGDHGRLQPSGQRHAPGQRRQIAGREQEQRHAGPQRRVDRDGPGDIERLLQRMDSDHHQDGDAAHGVDGRVTAGRRCAGIRDRSPLRRWSSDHGHVAVSCRGIAGTAADGAKRRSNALVRYRRSGVSK